MEKTWEDNLAIASIPPTTDPEIPSEPGPAREAAVKERAKLISTRPTFLLKLQIAQAFRYVSTLYFPTSADFRGRVYPVPLFMKRVTKYSMLLEIL